MPKAPPAFAGNLFLEMVSAVRRGVPMIPRSANDKEYFAQDWFIDRLKSLGLPFKQQGRNSYPDFWVGEGEREGFEIKSLAFASGRPARKDLDFNSTIPSGLKQGHPVFLVFFLYTGTGARNGVPLQPEPAERCHFACALRLHPRRVPAPVRATVQEPTADATRECDLPVRRIGHGCRCGLSAEVQRHAVAYLWMWHLGWTRIVPTVP